MHSEADPRSLQLSELADCAYRLGVQFAAAAEAAEALDRKIELFQHFERCFFGVRVATALQLRLLRTPQSTGTFSAATRSAERGERLEIERLEPLDRSDADSDGRPERYTERDREGDREVERANFPLLLRTLQGVADDAATLPGPEPADLPRLRHLLAAHTPPPGPARARPAPTPAPAPAGGLRDRLAASGSAQAQVLARLPAAALGFRPSRRATGPPAR